MTSAGQAILNKIGAVMDIDAHPARKTYGISISQGYARYAVITPPLQNPQFGSKLISTTELNLCRLDVEVITEFSRSLLTLVHIMYLLFFHFLLVRQS
jgi:hypothetical protein